MLSAPVLYSWREGRLDGGFVGHQAQVNPRTCGHREVGEHDFVKVWIDDKHTRVCSSEHLGQSRERVERRTYGGGGPDEDSGRSRFEVRKRPVEDPRLWRSGWPTSSLRAGYCMNKSAHNGR